MILLIPSFIFKIYATSFLLWVLFTTSIPQTLIKYTNAQIQNHKFVGKHYPQTSITVPKQLVTLHKVTNSTVYFLIAHPDDEVMFFAPSILELSKPHYGNTVQILCFSKGDSVDASMGEIRQQELYNSARILGIDKANVMVLDYKDGMNETWHTEDIIQSLKENINRNKIPKVVLITFDELGVSSHPNHIALYHGARKYINLQTSISNGPSSLARNKQNLKQPRDPKEISPRLYVLKSLGFLEKYSFTILTNIEFLIDYVTNVIKTFATVNINVSFFTPANSTSSIKIYSDLNMLACSYAAMAYGHLSQMVWFRYGWLMLSRYLTFNQLLEIKSV